MEYFYFNGPNPNQNPHPNANANPNCCIRMVTKWKVMGHARWLLQYLTAGVRQNRFYPHNFWKISIGVDFQAHYLINKKKVQQKSCSNALKYLNFKNLIFMPTMKIGLLWLTPHSTIFPLYRGGQFGGRNWSTRRKPQVHFDIVNPTTMQSQSGQPLWKSVFINTKMVYASKTILYFFKFHCFIQFCH